MSAELLELNRVSKRYAVTVLDRVSFGVNAGEVHALLGSNGAGKSTLCKIIAGLTPASSGSMTLAGQLYSPTDKQAAEKAGVQIVQQELSLVSTLTVAENMFLNRLPHRLGLVQQSQLKDGAARALDRLGLTNLDPSAPISTLGVGKQQLVEIASALDRECRLLILDEPTSSLSATESEELFAQIRSLKQQGIAIIYISHRLDEVSDLADRITVLRDGEYVDTREARSLTPDGMVAMMTGDAAADHDPASYTSRAQEETILEVGGLSRGRRVRDVSFSVHRGERFGIAGLVGAGRTELLRLIFGADRADAGYVRICGEEAEHCFRHPHQSVEAGLAMVTEDRKTSGLLLPLSIRANTSLAALATRYSNRGLIRSNAESNEVRKTCDRLEVRHDSIEQAVETLSGGNQQKIAIGKWMLRDAAIYLLDEPTRGIDVAARRRIYRQIEMLASEGKGIVIVSSDLDELLETCDRIMVMSDGKMVEIFDRGNWSVDSMTEAAFSEHRGVKA